MYYHTTKISDAKLIHNKHPNANLALIKRLISIGLSRNDCGLNTAIYITPSGKVEYCTLSYSKENEYNYGPQGTLPRTIKY